MKSPFNWVGNKYKYLDKINEIVGGREYERVIEPFMGTGNILFNISTPAHIYIGNDNIALLPRIYTYIKDSSPSFFISEIKNIIQAWNNFSDKEDYYTFRNYWNSKYTNNIMDKDFIYETALLLKMCSNSMVRFNRNGEFNQGFRGLAKGKIEFFSETMKIGMITQINQLAVDFSKKNYKFSIGDFKDILIDSASEDLFILDPPYILRTDMYDMNYTKEDDEFLLNFLINTKNDFIYFNYLESGNEINQKINNLFENRKFLRIEYLNDKTKAGQGRKGTKNVKEVIITNIEVN